VSFVAHHSFQDNLRTRTRDLDHPIYGQYKKHQQRARLLTGAALGCEGLYNLPLKLKADLEEIVEAGKLMISLSKIERIG
jgi:hypothetical protein